MDVQKYCAGVEAGDGRILKCLKEHKGELSDECRTVEEEPSSKKGKRLSECREDIQKHCHGVKKGRGRLQRCLKQKGKPLLSAACSTALGL